MTDLVERLRKPGMNTLTAEERVVLVFGMFNEAADEIEQLQRQRGAVLAVLANGQGIAPDTYQARCEQALELLQDADGGGQGHENN